MPLGGPASQSDLLSLASKLANQIELAGVQGFSLVVRQGGVLVPGCDIPSGTARPGLPWSSDTRMQVASVSKFITAVGVLQLLHILGMTPDDPIHPWLPPYWGASGQAIELLTFRDLLRHQSGFHCVIQDLSGPTSPFPSMNTFLQCKTVAQSSSLLKTDALGSQNPSAPSCYENLNYDLIRVLMASMVGELGTLHSVTNDAIWDVASIAKYQDYMNSFVMSMSGVRAAGFSDPNGSAAQIYLQRTNFPGTETGDSSESAASGGWYLSANDILNVAGAFRRQRLLDPYSFDNPPPDPNVPNAWFAPQNVLASYYGMDWAFTIGDIKDLNAACSGPSAYAFFSKQGSVPVPVYWPSGTPHPGTVAFFTSLNSYLWFLPNDVEVALLVNSMIGPTRLLGPNDDPTDLGNYDARNLLAGIIWDYFPGTYLHGCSVSPGASCAC